MHADSAQYLDQQVLGLVPDWGECLPPDRSLLLVLQPRGQFHKGVALAQRIVLPEAPSLHNLHRQEANVPAAARMVCRSSLTQLQAAYLQLQRLWTCGNQC